MSIPFKVLENTKSAELFKLEKKYSAHNYTPLPIIVSEGHGEYLYDVDGNKYLDFGSSYGATNTGHNHPIIINEIKEQYDKIALPSRAFTHNLFGKFCETVCTRFGYEKVLPLNGGAEAIEFTIKLCRSWGYIKKGIPLNEAKVIMMKDNFHGRTIGVTSGSTNEEAKENYGPFLPNVGPKFGLNNEFNVIFNDINSLEKCFQLEGNSIAGLIFETVQGERGIYVPDIGYLEKVRELCDKYNVLWCADEVQMGSYRCGNKFFAFENLSKVKPDVVATAKSITGGVYPSSIVLSSKEIMDTIGKNTHGATFSGSPIACAATIATLKVYDDEKLGEKGVILGKEMFKGLYRLKEKYPLIEDIRGVGLIAGIDINMDILEKKGMNVWHVCMFLRAMGIACKMVHEKTIRFCPSLVMNISGVKEGISALEICCQKLPYIEANDIPGVEIFAYSH
ncbi:ornithine aminotransferase [Pichia californica]|uniref:Ornithine aminotransferase n=1 Tax=Pichia californica TaxID=460514 RepID=A0A9P6WN74_9ASCO|nr:ornithine aminotransferase [[Candida] californica]KAG0690186.1 ornithine aminotransferase [[Candida] californica]